MPLHQPRRTDGRTRRQPDYATDSGPTCRCSGLGRFEFAAAPAGPAPESGRWAARGVKRGALMASSSAKTGPFVGALVGLLLARSVVAQDWPQWRGPDRDGAVRGVK